MCVEPHRFVAFVRYSLHKSLPEGALAALFISYSAKSNTEQRPRSVCPKFAHKAQSARTAKVARQRNKVLKKFALRRRDVRAAFCCWLFFFARP